MAADQQFCLRWNNHQSTLISVFDTLLENGTLVDCTLAAEGQYLKAHKVVLSACSPYMETLLSQNYDKHPILILKDVKFTELKSMMDYMYRGEVNISQDQLGTFLKAAESLQIKGLSENGEGDARDVGSTNANPPPPRRPPATRPEPEAAQSPAHRSRDGSVSPSSRKRRRLRRNSDDGDNHIESNSCDVPAQSTPVPNIPASITTTPIRTPIVKPEVNDRLDHNTLPAESGLLKEKIEPAEPLLEPKTEYLEDLNNDDSVEDLTLDDDDEMDMSQMSNLSNMSRPGPSHGADLSNQGFPPWQLGNQSGTDEVFMAAQEAVNAHRDSQDSVEEEKEDEGFECSRCNQQFKSRSRLVAHLRQVRQKSKEHCFVCGYRSAATEDLNEHLQLRHPEEDLTNIYICQECEESFHTREDTICHLQDCKGKQYAGEETDKSMMKNDEESRALKEYEEALGIEIVIPQEEEVENAKAIESISKDVPAKNEYPQELVALDRMFHFFNTKSIEEIKNGYKCPDCGRVYKSYNTAKDHLKTICKNPEPSYSCKMCSVYKTRQKSNLRVHMRLIHKAPDTYICDQCGKDFKTKKSFTFHSRYDCVSLGPKPHKCHLCDFSTKIPGILNTHLFKVHNVETKLAEKVKPTKKDIPDPIKMPEGYKCPNCPTFFELPDNYKRHYRFSCSSSVKPRSVNCLLETCRYKTHNVRNLQQHMMRSHGIFTKVKQGTLVLVDKEESDSDS